MSEFREREALLRAVTRAGVDLPDNFHVHRRNLLASSVLVLAAMIISPIEGQYPVNLGLIQGEVENIVYIYIGLMLLCFYQLWYFWSICRQLIVNHLQVSSNDYFLELAKGRALDKWHDIAMPYIARSRGVTLESFSGSLPSTGQRSFEVHSTDIHGFLEDHPELANELKSSEFFKLNKKGRNYEIVFPFYPAESDFNYFFHRRDLLWLAKRHSFVEFWIPLLLGYSSLVLVLNRVSTIVLT